MVHNGRITSDSSHASTMYLVQLHCNNKQNALFSVHIPGLGISASAAMLLAEAADQPFGEQGTLHLRTAFPASVDRPSL